MIINDLVKHVLLRSQMSCNSVCCIYYLNPLSTCLISELKIKEIQTKINRRPRKKLGYLTPVQVFYRILPEDVALAG